MVDSRLAGNIGAGILAAPGNASGALQLLLSSVESLAVESVVEVAASLVASLAGCFLRSLAHSQVHVWSVISWASLVNSYHLWCIRRENDKEL